MADLGDISSFIQDGTLTNLDWADINEDDYRALETLPKQNLDIAPDLEAIWNREDGSGAKIVPNRAGQPRTMGDLSDVHGLLRAKPEDIRKVARLTIMQSDDTARMKDALTKRFDTESLRAARPVLAAVLAERGLLGRIYIDASDFPTCATNASQPVAFTKRYASGARYVLAKNTCAGCVHALLSPTGGQTCAVFHKEIKVQVPYTPALADQVEQLQRAKGKQLTASPSQPPRERIRLAMLAPTATTHQSAPSAKPVETVTRLLRPVVDSGMLRLAADQARPVLQLLRREMLKGRSEDDLHQVLKHAFQSGVLEATAPFWAPVANQSGLYGVAYSTQDSFSDCHEGADFLAKHNPGVRAVVEGSKCASCIYNKIHRCLIYGKPLRASIEATLTPEVVESVLSEHKLAGRIAPWDNRQWGSTPAESLRAIHKAAVTTAGLPQQVPPRMEVIRQHYAATPQASTSGMTRRLIVKTAREYLNEGLYGADLLQLLKSKFDKRDLVAAATELRPVIAEQGLQGIFYVDPTVYEDYGRGCEKAAHMHRSRGVPYLKMGPKCGSCVLHTRPGYCSKIDKPLVEEPPYVDKLAQQRGVLASGKSTETDYGSLVNNGRSMMAEYQIQQRGMDIELDPVVTSKPLDISFK